MQNTSPKRGYGYSHGPDTHGLKVGMSTANDYGHIIGLRTGNDSARKSPGRGSPKLSMKSDIFSKHRKSMPAKNLHGVEDR